MQCIHITPEDNLNSIKKFGLLPTKSFLHPNRMKASFKTDKVIYLALLENKKRMAKYIKDFIYCKVWIYPRINFMREEEINQKNEEKIYSHKFELIGEIFSILLIDFELKGKYMKSTHEQSGFFGMKDIDERFTHDDKPLVITPEKIPAFQIKEVGDAFPVIRNNKIQNVKLEGWE